MGILSFLGFTILVAVITYFASRKYKGDIIVKDLTALTIAGSLLLTNLSTEQIVGLNGQAFTEGILVMAWETLAAIAMVVTAIFLLPRYMKGKIITIPQFLEQRYDLNTKYITSGLFLTGYAVVFLPIVLYTGSIAINTMFDVPQLLGVSDNIALWICVFSIGIIGSIYGVFGGLKAVVISDTINAVGLLIGGVMIPVFGFIAIGDGSMMDGMNILFEENADKFDAIGDSESSIPFATIFTGMMLVQLFYWGTNQAIVQRALAAKNLEEGQKGILLASFIKILGPIIVVLPGIIAFHMFGDTLEKADEAYPMLVNKVLPTSLVGFFAAVLFGAILSSFNSAINSSVALFALDIYKPYINKEASEQKVERSGKLFGIGLALFAMFIAPLLQYTESIFSYLQQVNGCYSVPILTIVVLGILSKRIPAIAAKVAIFAGAGLYLAYIILDATILEGFFPHFLHMMAILTVLIILLMIIIGKLYPRETPFEQKYTGEPEYIEPWKYTKIVGVVICLLVVGVYIVFA
ncbi:solute:sodium symporter family transporter [Aquimarina sp. ERC-38]|uniref:solute:sodium symporter family transporter n=1 Tax=Aquimarina sp. ERC-38 TaxID=2949996 RepID=UPI002245B2BF|nr:solute:sodium symporter family transporter [Aquimarina sp. ERC-38]UZO80597.1 solute:sodium symporter family transporter [Aquimarina sp. ERC-38]